MAADRIQISVCLTTFNRTQLLYEAIENVKDDARISEIVVVDDHSNYETIDQLETYFNTIPKVRFFVNEYNLDCYRNKREAVSKAKSEWVLIWDSDNKFPVQYLDRIESLIQAGLNPKTVYQPEFAKPHFDFTQFSGMNVTRSNVASRMLVPQFETMLNAFNYFVNRDEFLRVWQDGEPVTSDSIFHNYNWLNAGNSIYVVEGLQYEHRVHEGSHYQNNIRRTPEGFHESIVNKLKQMR